MAVRRPRDTGEGIQRRFRFARVEAALTDTTTALLMGGTGIVAVIAAVAETRGVLNAGTWIWVVIAGAMVTLGKIALDFRDKRKAGTVWRNLLNQSFGEDMRSDGESARLARIAIEFRVRLAEAEAAAPLSAQERIAGVLPRLDQWVELIIELARKVAGLRSEARFQAGLAVRVRSRLAEIEGRMAEVEPAQRARLAETAHALAGQVNSFDAFNTFVEEGALRLEHAVGVFSAAVSQIVLELSQGELKGSGLASTIGTEITELESKIEELDQTAPLQRSDPIKDNSIPEVPVRPAT